ncbi:hypothetical protein B0H11DRAFT_1926472 [Mycena galericulata]|nr:hypothetical protein B0H11DRAFT_1926472 [Mycena galericulata]
MRLSASNLPGCIQKSNQLFYTTNSTYSSFVFGVLARLEAKEVLNISQPCCSGRVGLESPGLGRVGALRAVRRPVDGHGRRFGGTWTGTVRRATAVIRHLKLLSLYIAYGRALRVFRARRPVDGRCRRARPSKMQLKSLTERVGYPSHGTRKTGTTGTANSPRSTATQGRVGLGSLLRKVMSASNASKYERWLNQASEADGTHNLRHLPSPYRTIFLKPDSGSGKNGGPDPGPRGGSGRVGLGLGLEARPGTSLALKVATRLECDL